MGEFMNRMIVFDGNSILNREFYGVKPLTTKDGFPTNALHGFVKKLCKELSDGFTHAVIAFDLPEKTFRHIKCDTYKATRKPMPEDLAKQLPIAKQLASSLGLNVIEVSGYEADDVIGTLSRISAENGCECIIVTGDRDSYQLVNDSVKVWLASNKGTVIMDRNAINELYGLTPSQLIDLKAIMGDSSDNIKGVAGIGEKGALVLMHEYGSLDSIYEHIDEIKGATQTKLINGKDDAYMSRFLAEIVKNVPISNALEDYLIKARDDRTLYELFTKLEFSTLLTSLSVEKPVTEAEEIKCEDADAAFLASLEAEKLYMCLENDSLSVFDGNKLYACPYDESVISIFNTNKKIVFWSSKEILRFCFENGYDFKNEYDDISLMAYLVSPVESGLTPEKAVQSYLEISAYDNLCPLLPHLEEKLLPIIHETDNDYLYYKVELPLAKLLAEIEATGFMVDTDGLRNYGNELKDRMNDTEKTIYSLVGHEFNINSPKQLGTVLFDELKLPHFKKTQSGYSTNAEVLEKLSPYHPIIDLILYYRKIAKLKSTYCDGLLEAVSYDGRVHTTFKQTLTKTGRLSSTEPNLQNIPVKTEEGRMLRRFFTSKDGYVLIDADYSQIELRVLSHVSGDEVMINAFLSGKDIHTSTASKVFHVPESGVTSIMRKQAKAVNFGIVYGISDYSLSQDIGLTKKQAAEYIKSYLDTYPDVRDYLERVKSEAKENGYVTTIYGRRRYIPELKSSKKSLVSFGERVAMNTPIQGSAADIIKIAMLKANEALKANGLDARIILQVHDELIVEASKDCAKAAEKVLVEAMETAVSLSVPLTSDVGIGSNWLDAKN